MRALNPVVTTKLDLSPRAAPLSSEAEKKYNAEFQRMLGVVNVLGAERQRIETLYGAAVETLDGISRALGDRP